MKSHFYNLLSQQPPQRRRRPVGGSPSSSFHDPREVRGDTELEHGPIVSTCHTFLRTIISQCQVHIHYSVLALALIVFSVDTSRSGKYRFMLRNQGLWLGLSLNYLTILCNALCNFMHLLREVFLAPWYSRSEELSQICFTEAEQSQHFHEFR